VSPILQALPSVSGGGAPFRSFGKTSKGRRKGKGKGAGGGSHWHQKQRSHPAVAGPFRGASVDAFGRTGGKQGSRLKRRATAASPDAGDGGVEGAEGAGAGDLAMPIMAVAAAAGGERGYNAKFLLERKLDREREAKHRAREAGSRPAPRGGLVLPSGKTMPRWLPLPASKRRYVVRLMERAMGAVAHGGTPSNTPLLATALHAFTAACEDHLVPPQLWLAAARLACFAAAKRHSYFAGGGMSITLWYHTHTH